MIPLLFFAALIVALIFGPQMWARHVLKRHRRDADEFPGSGAQFARHLLTTAKMQHVKVELTEAGDHYDPIERKVRLSPEVHDGHHLTAVVVAAHEVGHAIQDHIGYGPLALRTRLIALSARAEKLGSILLVALPFISVLTKLPALGVMLLALGVVSLAIPVLVHLVTLPVEIDASFKRALPILALGYVADDRMPAARQILTACALTYVAASLATLLNFWRWIAILRR